MFLYKKIINVSIQRLALPAHSALQELRACGDHLNSQKALTLLVSNTFSGVIFFLEKLRCSRAERRPVRRWCSSGELARRQCSGWSSAGAGCPCRTAVNPGREQCGVRERCCILVAAASSHDDGGMPGSDRTDTQNQTLATRDGNFGHVPRSGSGPETRNHNEWKLGPKTYET